MTFATREEAGRLLGRYLQAREVRADLVLGLPRGGVIVAAPVARALNLPLDLLIVRKIGHPWQREFALGALAEPDVVVFDQSVIGADAAMHQALKDVVREEQARLQRHRDRFRLTPPMELCGKAVLLVDDGLATGATTEAAALSARKQGAARTAIASPVASSQAVRRLGEVADEVIALHVDEDFDAVGRYYAEFEPTTDQELFAALQQRRANWV